MDVKGPRCKKHRALERFEVPCVIICDKGTFEQTIEVFAANKDEAVVDGVERLDLKVLPSDPGFIIIRAKEGYLND